jgi:hypothetical protein
MKVIGAGFGRTGTLSLKLALEELGLGPCHHMSELFDKPERAPLWEAAFRGEQVDWGTLLEGFESTADWPSCTFYARLMEAYPEAKVVLTVRDPEEWYRSVRNTIYGSERDETPPPDEDPVHRMIRNLVWEGTFGGEVEDKQRAIATYLRHIEEVRDTVPADRLLVFDVREGWEPLCRFLEVEVPVGKPFPRVNSTADWKERAASAPQSTQEEAGSRAEG